MLVSGAAFANPNDITLQRFGQCVGGTGGSCPATTTNEPAFRALARDLGLVMAPKGLVTAETLGVAGFAIQIDQNINTVNANDEHWQLGNLNGDPNGTLNVTQLHIRKGLPFSFELGGTFNVLWDSSLVAVGTELRWALHEDYLWPVPDLGVRAYANTVLGSPQLNLTNAGFDVVVSLPFGVGGVMNITPFLGYNMNVVISASRLIDATPNDPTPPFEDLSNPAESNAPEFVFGVENEIIHQGIGGLRFQFGIANLTTQVTAGSYVQTYSVSLGLDF